MTRSLDMSPGSDHIRKWLLAVIFTWFVKKATNMANMTNIASHSSNSSNWRLDQHFINGGRLPASLKSWEVSYRWCICFNWIRDEVIMIMSCIRLRQDTKVIQKRRWAKHTCPFLSPTIHHDGLDCNPKVAKKQLGTLIYLLIDIIYDT